MFIEHTGATNFFQALATDFNISRRLLKVLAQLFLPHKVFFLMVRRNTAFMREQDNHNSLFLRPVVGYYDCDDNCIVVFLTLLLLHTELHM